MLEKNGVFISITFAQPHFRKPLYALDKYNWSIDLFTVGDTFHYFVYVMTKCKPLKESDKNFNFYKNDKKLFKNLEIDSNENFLFEINTD